MNDHDLTPFELQLAARMRSYAAVQVPTHDSLVIARSTMTLPRRRTLGERWQNLRLVPRLAFVALLLLGALLAVALIGSWLRSSVPATLFTTTEPLFANRWRQAAVRLDGGAVLIVGGFSTAANELTTLSSAEVWDPATGHWRVAGVMGAARVLPTATLLRDGRVLVAGGQGLSGGSYSLDATAELYDPATGTFVRTGSMSRGRAMSHFGDQAPPPRAVTLQDGRVFIVGGAQGNPDVGFPGADIYTPATGTFRTTPPVPCVDVRTATALLDGRVLITCLRERYASQADATAWIYDPEADSVSQTGAPTTTNTESAVLLADGRVLLSGSVRSLRPDEVRDPAEVYDPRTGSFTRLGAMSTPGSNAIRLADGRVFFSGGYTSGGPTGLGSNATLSAAAELFDPTTNTFARTLDLPTTRWYQTQTLLADGRVLIVGSSGDRPDEAPLIFNPAEVP